MKLRKLRHVLVVALMLGEACISSTDVKLTVLSPIPDYIYHPRLNINDSAYIDVPSAAINVEFGEGPISDAVKHHIRYSPSSYELCIDWNATNDSLTALFPTACRGLLGGAGERFMVDPAILENGKAGEIMTYRFRSWLRHLLCTDIRALEDFACYVPNESKQPSGENGLQPLPIDWVLHTLTEITFSIVVPGKPTSLVIGTPAHQSFLDAPASIYPMVALQLTESTLSDHVRAAPDTFQLCYTVSTEFTHRKEAELMRRPVRSSTYTTRSTSESIYPTPRCVILSQNAQLQPFDLDGNNYDLQGSYAQHHLEVWLQRKPSANAASINFQSSEKLAKVAHVFFSRATHLPCALSDQNTRSLNSSLAASSHVHIYGRGQPGVSSASSRIKQSELQCQQADAMSPSQVRQLLIVAAPRSGTHFSVAALQRLGVQVNHEGVGPDGSVSWFYAHQPGAAGYPINLPEPLRNQRFCFIFHQVRHPLRVMSSNIKVNLGASQPDIARWKLEREPRICTGSDTSFEDDNDQVSKSSLYFEECMQLPVLLRAARLWLYWNLHIESYADARFRVEDTDPQHLCELAKFSSCQSHSDSEIDKLSIREVDQAVSAIRSDASILNLAASWEDLKALDLRLEADVRGMALRYGYKADPLEHPQASFMRAR